MRTLEFSNPYKPTRAEIHKEYLNAHVNGNYEKSCSVITKFGIVLVAELKWQTNFGWTIFTYFTTYIDGFIHSAWLKESGLSDLRIKWMAIHFITLLKKENADESDNLQDELDDDTGRTNYDELENKYQEIKRHISTLDLNQEHEARKNIKDKFNVSQYRHVFFYEKLCREKIIKKTIRGFFKILHQVDN